MTRHQYTPGSDPGAAIGAGGRRWRGLDFNRVYYLYSSVFFSTLACQAITPLAPLMRSELAISRAGVGLVSNARFLGGVVGSICAAYLVERFGFRSVLLAGLGIIGVSTSLATLSRSTGSLLGWLFIAGLGYSTVSPATVKAVIKWFPSQLRATTMGIKEMGIPIGGACAAYVLPTIADAHGWRVALFVVSIATSLFWAVSTLGLCPRGEDQGKPDMTPQQPSGSMLDMTVAVFNNSSLSLVILAGSLLYASAMCFQSYLMLFLMDSVSLSLSQAAVCLSVAQLTGALGRLIFGLAADALRGSYRRYLLNLNMAFMALLLILGRVGASTPYWIVVLLSMLLGLTGTGWVPTSLSLMTRVADDQTASIAAGVRFVASSVAAVIIPPLFGLTVDLTGSFGITWRLLALYSAIPALALLRVKEPAFPG